MTAAPGVTKAAICGATAPFIPRMGLSFKCVLDAGHSGDHSAGMAQWPQAPHAAAHPSITHTVEIGTTTAAPGVTKEVEAAIDAFENVVHEACMSYEGGNDPASHVDTARAALLAAIEKYGDERHSAGFAWAETTFRRRHD